mmetsp:Transcript_22349/g.60400  ORF Transcript_22349/g.60400 Transcript_22349/m.60400 type:complete len:301 (-) Transcript_22349:738-1640(-)
MLVRRFLRLVVVHLMYLRLMVVVHTMDLRSIILANMLMVLANKLMILANIKLMILMMLLTHLRLMVLAPTLRTGFHLHPPMDLVTLPTHHQTRAHHHQTTAHHHQTRTPHRTPHQRTRKVECPARRKLELRRDQARVPRIPTRAPCLMAPTAVMILCQTETHTRSRGMEAMAPYPQTPQMARRRTRSSGWIVSTSRPASLPPRLRAGRAARARLTQTGEVHLARTGPLPQTRGMLAPSSMHPRLLAVWTMRGTVEIWVGASPERVPQQGPGPRSGPRLSATGARWSRARRVDPILLASQQ